MIKMKLKYLSTVINGSPEAQYEELNKNVQ